MHYHNHILRNSGFTPPVLPAFVYSVTVGAAETISLPMASGLDALYNFTVNFGDGSGDKFVTAYADPDRQNTYTLAGTYDITITGQFDYIRFTDSPLSIIELKEWGPSSIGQSSFSNCSNFATISSTDSPGLYLTNMLDCFRSCPLTSVNASINSWDMSAATSLNGMFRNGTFNQFIGGWNVSNVTAFTNLFLSNTAFNQDLSTWDTGNVTSMVNVFNGATSFNQDISDWDMSSVTSIVTGFLGASTFNNGGVSLDWANTGLVSNWFGAFQNCIAFNQNVSGLNMSSATNMQNMFQGCSIFNQDVSDWNVSNVTNMTSMFRSCIAFNNGGVTLDWADSSSVTTMDGMFAFAAAFNQPVPFNTSSVTDMDVMFQSATAFNQDISGFDVTGLTTATNMLLNVTLSTVNYDALLVGWEAQAVLNNVPFHGGNSTYTGAGAGGTARAALIADHTWTITDGGAV